MGWIVRGVVVVNGNWLVFFCRVSGGIKWNCWVDEEDCLVVGKINIWWFNWNGVFGVINYYLYLWKWIIFSRFSIFIVII